MSLVHLLLDAAKPTKSIMTTMQCSLIYTVPPSATTTPKLPCLLSKQTADSSQHTVFLWVIRVVFARYLEDRREGSGVSIDAVTYPVSNLDCIRC